MKSSYSFLSRNIVLLILVQVHLGWCAFYEDHKYKCPKRQEIIYPCVCLKGSDSGIFVRCENVNLATLSVAAQNLGDLDTQIEELIIYKGQIAHLFGPLFAKINARKLVINEVPLTTIEEYTFHGINKTLKELHIINSKIEGFPAKAFAFLSNLTELNINGHNIETLAKDIFFEKPISNNLEILRLTNGTLKDLPIESFQPLRKLKTLDLNGNQLETLKRSQFKNLRDVEVLDISFNKIKKLEAQHIADLTKLGWCNASNNAISDLPRGTFARNSVLKWLNLSFNKIQRLDANSFRGMRFLRRLYLNDNQLSDIGRGTFGSVTRIGTIDLARNLLKKVDFQMFSQLNYVEIINVAENNITIIEKNSFKDIYQSIINASHNEIETIESLAFENCVNITVLDLSFNKLSTIPRNTFDETTFATELQLSHNFFSDLSQIPLHNMTGLKTLNISHNLIEKIPKNTFPKLYELHTIDLSHNNLNFIWNGVFQVLFSLRFLNLSHNSLEEIKSSALGTLPTVLELDLRNNKLNSIVRGALAKLSSVRSLHLEDNQLDKLFQIPISLNELYLARNKLKSLPSGTWPVMNSLLYLDLTENELGDSLEDASFAGLLVLQTLVLNRNNITFPPTPSLLGISTLQYLHLEDNNITKLEKSAFGKLPVLFDLNLSNNGVNNISKRAFEGLLQLLVLNLSSNALESIPNDAFRGLPSLRTLDLSHNRLSKFDNKTHSIFDDLLSLEKLNLSNNKISFITKKTFPSNQYIPYNLRNLDLSYNIMPVLTYDITYGTKKLVKLNLSHNHINDIRRGVLGNFTSLETLDLSFNNLTDLTSEDNFEKLPPNLKILNIRHNQIFRIPFDKLLQRVKLSTFDLRGNAIDIYPLSLLTTLKNRSQVLFQDNPLYCNCAVRPLLHYIQSKTNLSSEDEHITCATPVHLSGTPLYMVSDEKLQCSSDDNDKYKDHAYDVLPDIQFRDVIVQGNHIILRWYVSSTKDVADFTVYVRNKNNEIFYEQDFKYFERTADIPTSSIQELTKSGSEGEICIISKSSAGTVGRWFESQCTPPPDVSKNSLRQTFWAQTSTGVNIKNTWVFVLIGFSFLILL